jgi:hypothetical protein
MLSGAQRAWWGIGEVVWRGVHPGAERFDDTDWTRLREFGKVELPDGGWRPLRVRLTLAPAPGAPGSRSAVTIAIDDARVHRAMVGPRGGDLEFVLRGHGAREGRLALQVTSETFDADGRGVAVSGVTVEPVVTPWSVARNALRGIGLGALLWVLWWWPAPLPRVPASAPQPAVMKAARGELLAFGVAVFALFSMWVVLKPPCQAPDESGHFVRALAMPGVPWLSRTAVLPVRGTDWNPLIPLPGQLAYLPFHPDQRLNRVQLAEIQAIPWPTDAAIRREPTQAWTYPPGFYALTYASGAALTRLLDATPYASWYLYRWAIAFFAAVCWTWVFAGLSRTAGLSEWRWWMAGVCLANPMVAFMASSINPDALHVPLIVLGMLLGHAVFAEGKGRRQLVVVLLLAALTKASALILVAALSGAAVLLVATRSLPWQSAVNGMRPVAGAALASVLALSMWTPLVLYGTPRNMDLAQYWGELQKYGWQRWVWFWGQPGWLDYQGPEVLYTSIVWLVGVNLIAAAGSLVRDWRVAGVRSFVVVASSLFVLGTLAGEYAMVSKAGLTFQGRYVLPVMLGVAVLTRHNWRTVRWALVLAIVALHLSLAGRSVTRYYGDVGTWCTSLPGGVTRVWCAAPGDDQGLRTE